MRLDNLKDSIRLLNGVGSLHVYDLGADMFKIASRFACDRWVEASDQDDWLLLRTSESSRLPCNPMILSLEGFDRGVLLRETCGEISVDLVGQKGARHIGSWAPGHVCDVTARSTDEEAFAYFVTLDAIAMLVALINEPGIVVKAPGGTRQQRRALARAMFNSQVSWTQISWDISKETLKRLSKEPNFKPKPLHFRSGHYRIAEPHYVGAMRRPNALRLEDRALWWQWIDAQWVGNMAFGVKFSTRSPKASLGRLASRRRAA